jgi:hypothetical protein
MVDGYVLLVDPDEKRGNKKRESRLGSRNGGEMG